MNVKDKQFFIRVRVQLLLGQYTSALMIMEEWSPGVMDYGQEAGHTDKTFNNYGSGRADR